MRLKINFVIDSILLILFILCGISGIIKIPELNIILPNNLYDNFSYIHDWSGIACIIFIIIHLILHIKWLNKTSKYFFPKKSITNTINTKQANKTIFGLVVMVLIFFGQNVFAFDKRHKSAATVPQGNNYINSTLKDGVYTGTANGYMPNLSVDVIVKDGKIKNVNILENSETPRWFTRVIDIIPNNIIKNQSNDIDVVSGATSSSHGIMAAVEDALKKSIN